ncbi:aldehyde ferredoxin oxidoreductase family protein [Chloroflexota bacterium]
MLGGYVGKLLRVNLTKGTITEESLPAEAKLRKYIGGLGLGLKMMDEEQAVDVKPLDPENHMYFMTGPLTGTPVLSANNLAIVTLSHETGYTVGSSHSHGYFAPYLKFAGYDGIIIEGAAKKPVYLSISAEKVEIHDALHIWGKDTHETEDIIKNELGDREETSVATIGPAGENFLAGAAICNDKHHLWAKGGVGAIMGSKKLKGIAVSNRGGKGIPIANVEDLIKVALEWRESALSPPVWYSMLSGPHGTHGGWWRYSGKLKVLPEWALREAEGLRAVKNLSDPEFGPYWTDQIYSGATKFKTTAVGCFSCPRACTYQTEITTGPYKGTITTLGGGGENIEAAGGMIGVTDPGTIFYLTDLYDRLGLDSSTPGCAVSLAFECYERGILTKKDTDGLELNWGNADAAIELLNKMVKREGFGAVLADGPKKAAERIGGDASKYVVHIKGGGPNMHDWRSAWSVMLAQIMSGAGPCWQGAGADAYSPEPDLGYPELTKNPVSAEGKPEASYKTHCKKLLEDCLGTCWFAAWGVPGVLDFERRAVAATVGWNDVTVDELLTLGHRVSTMQRLFNMKHGLTKESDFDIGQRFLEAPTAGLAKGKAFGDHMVEMVEEFYRLEGWDPATGRPLPKTIKQLGLEKVAKGLK